MHAAVSVACFFVSACAEPSPPEPRPVQPPRPSCAFHHADCDRSAENGCEVDLRSDPAHCGHCAASCLGTGVADAVCVEGACKILRCTEGRGDCDGRPDNGCEGVICQRSHGPECKPACDESFGYEF